MADGTTQFRFVGLHPENLDSGRVVVPGDFLDVDDEEQKGSHFKRLKKEGSLLDVAEASEPTADDLQAKAQALDVPGRSTMNKAELAKAIAKAEKEDKN